MPIGIESDYYQHRAAVERERARTAGVSPAARVHLELARLYEDRAHEWSDAPSQIDTVPFARG